MDPPFSVTLTRGVFVEQPTLRIIIGMAKLSRLSFAALASVDVDGRQQFTCETCSPEALEEEFLSV